MKTFHTHTDGRLMVMEQAGGTGGGATSASARFATDDEITGYHAEEVRKAEEALAAAHEAHDRHLDRVTMPTSVEESVGTNAPYEAVQTEDGRWDVVDRGHRSLGYHEHEPSTEEGAREFAEAMNRPPEPPPPNNV